MHANTTPMDKSFLLTGYKRNRIAFKTTKNYIFSVNFAHYSNVYNWNGIHSLPYPIVLPHFLLLLALCTILTGWSTIQFSCITLL